MLTIAHRGFSSRYPENTALAFEQAITVGADYIETDLRLSHDGAVVCCHDPDLKRIAGQTDTIAELGLGTIKSVALSEEQTILTLDEVLQIAYRRVCVMLDVKITTIEMLDRALPLIESADMVADVVYGARDLDHIVALKQRNDRIPILGMPLDMNLISEFIEAGVGAIRLWEEDVTADIVTQIKTAGKQVWATAGLRRQGEASGEITRDRITALHQAGIDAVLVNDPELVRQVLRKDTQDRRQSIGSPA